jgi:hypothetical protein
VSKTTETKDGVKLIKFVFHEVQTKKNESPLADTREPIGTNIVEISIKETESSSLEYYIYPPSKESISNVIGKELWQFQVGGTGCFNACTAILISAGVSVPSNGIIQIYSENTDNSSLIINSDNAIKGIKEIDNSLENFKRPIIVGINHSLNYKLKLSDGPVDFPNNDKTTEHFVVIVGRGYDVMKQKIFYNFFDVYKNDIAICTSSNNRLYLLDDYSLKELDNFVWSATKKYTVTQVRTNK